MVTSQQDSSKHSKHFRHYLHNRPSRDKSRKTFSDLDERPSCPDSLNLAFFLHTCELDQMAMEGGVGCCGEVWRLRGCFAETAWTPVGTRRLDVNKEAQRIRTFVVGWRPGISIRRERRTAPTLSHLCRPWRPTIFSSASQRLTKRSSSRADGGGRSSRSSTSRRLI